MQPGSVSIGGQKAPMRNLRRRLSPQAIDELVARYNAGEQTPALSREYGISKTGLRQVLLAEGVRFRMQPITPEDAGRAVQLYERGMTIRQVVEQVGYSYGTIRTALHEHGVAMRAGGIGKRDASDE
jgi:lambda repressor-like predicted transcriptional regulator